MQFMYPLHNDYINYNMFVYLLSLYFAMQLHFSRDKVENR